MILRFPAKARWGHRILALDQLHDEEMDAIDLLDLVDGGYVGVVERSEHVRLTLEPSQPTLALANIGLDDWDTAFRWWNRAIEVRDPFIMPIKTFPFFDPVRGDPRYLEILRRMNLVED